MAKRKTIALALGSGGARGYAHIGVIEEVLARGYDIRAISGCSMGALVGGIYAAGQLDAYRDWVCKLDYFDVLRLVDVTWSPMGAIRARRIMEELEALIGDTRIEDLPIPLTTVATDLIAQKEVWFQSGNLLEAIRASIAVPGVITPVQRDRKMLVDGGLMNPLPITPLVAAHVDLVLAVNATAHSPRNQTLEQMLPPAEAAEEEAREAALQAQEGGFGDWLRGVRRSAERMFSAEREATQPPELAEPPPSSTSAVSPLGGVPLPPGGSLAPPFTTLSEAPETEPATSTGATLNDVLNQAVKEGRDDADPREAQGRQSENRESRRLAEIEEGVDDDNSPEQAWGKLDMMMRSFDITQATLAKYKIAGYPPDILVEIPKTVCGAYEFHRAEGLIKLGRHLAAEALDRYEKGLDG
ncbi:patatin-like phospholipase family protein [Cobetia marina]|uniref:patatin-like phospholipase family protein n=1 Tax=Cobetia marina TaxID=28258 RepID=UPI00384CC230